MSGDPSNIQVGECADAEAWDSYVSTHSRASQYHQFAWLSLIERSLGHSGLPLAAYSHERIVGVLPLVSMRSLLFGQFIVSLPFVNYGGVLADDETSADALWRAGVEYARLEKAKFLEARHVTAHSFTEQRREHKASMVLDLAPDVDAQWKAFNAKLRNQIRKAERSGLRCRTGGAEELDRFYPVFARCMRDLGTPVLGRAFFAEVLETFPESSRVFVVETDDDTPVAAGIALAHRDCLEAPWAASLREHRPKCPNNLLYWEMIRHAIQGGLRRFDFGRSTPGDGPYRFKEQWGARPVPLVWEYWLRDGQELPNLNPDNSRFDWAIEVWKRLPVPLTKWVGPRIVRGIPA